MSVTKVKGAMKQILDMTATVAMTEGKDEVDKKQVIDMAGKLGKSTILNAFTSLKRMNLLIVTPKTLTITPLGKELADTENVPIMTTNEEYFAHVKDNYELKPKEIELFDLLADGKVHTKGEVSGALGMKLNSTFANLLTGMKKKKIIKYNSKTIEMEEAMFKFGKPE